ncbi:MAG: hypothetical protein EOO61_20430, partial [Hymenobacter sp.]
VRLLPRKPLSFLALGFLAVALCAPALHSWFSKFLLQDCNEISRTRSQVRYRRHDTRAILKLLEPVVYLQFRQFLIQLFQILPRISLSLLHEVCFK